MGRVTDLQQVDHLGVELGALGQGVEDEMVDAADTVAVEKVSAPGVQEQVAVATEKPRSGSSHLKKKNDTEAFGACLVGESMAKLVGEGPRAIFFYDG